MNMKQWLYGCLNSGLKQGAKLGLTVCTAYTIGSHLDVATLFISTSVGFIWGALEWVCFNPFPKDGVTPTPQLFKWLPTKKD